MDWWVGSWVRGFVGSRVRGFAGSRGRFRGRVGELPESVSVGFSFSTSTAGAKMSVPDRLATHPETIRTIERRIEYGLQILIVFCAKTRLDSGIVFTKKSVSYAENAKSTCHFLAS